MFFLGRYVDFLGISELGSNNFDIDCYDYKLKTPTQASHYYLVFKFALFLDIINDLIDLSL